ncbi:hypothetical protein D3C87_1509580 [compost metagenome]
MVIGRRLRTQGGHADVMHGGNAQADQDRSLEALPETQDGAAERMHCQPRCEQGDQQGNQRDGQLVVHVDGSLECQHADEVHGPDSAGQTSGTDPAPKPAGGGFFRMRDALGHVQCGKAASTGDQKSQQHQKRVMYAVEHDLPTLWQLGEEMQTKPLHSTPHRCFPDRRKGAPANVLKYRGHGGNASGSGKLVSTILEWALERLEIKCCMGRAALHEPVSALRIITDSVHRPD